MVVRVETPPKVPARGSAGYVSEAPANGSPPSGVTSFSREYMEYWAPLLQEGDAAKDPDPRASAGAGGIRQSTEAVSAHVKHPPQGP